MKLLKEILPTLSEGMFDDVVHENPSVEKLKAIAKGSSFNMARFIVKDGRIVSGADGYKNVHHDMLPPEAKAAPHAHGDSYIAKYPHQRGILDYVSDDRYEVRVKDYVHNNTVGNSSGWRLVDHPILGEFKKKGCTTFVPKKPVETPIAEAYSLVYHKQLNNKLFDGDRLEEDVRRALLRIGETFAGFAKIPVEAIKDIIFTGGNCNYNYSRFSDIDTHIIYDEKMLGGRGISDEMLNDYFISKKALWALTHDIKVKGYPVELYAQSYGSHLAASGVYSLTTNEWLTRPVHDTYKFKRDPLLNKTITDQINTLDSMIEDGDSEEEFRLMKEKIQNLRQAALASGNEFAWGNLIFKGLRNSGILNRMNEHLRRIRDKSLSLS